MEFIKEEAKRHLASISSEAKEITTILEVIDRTMRPSEQRGLILAYLRKRIKALSAELSQVYGGDDSAIAN